MLPVGGEFSQVFFLGRLSSLFVAFFGGGIEAFPHRSDDLGNFPERRRRVLTLIQKEMKVEKYRGGTSDATTASSSLIVPRGYIRCNYLMVQ